MSDTAEHMRLFTRVLGVVQSVAPTAVLAGGALRDATFHRPIKDLDIFLPESAFIPAIRDALKEEFGGIRYGLDVDWSSCDAMTDCVSSNTLTVLTEEDVFVAEVNLIRLVGAPSATAILERIDFGICQIGLTGPGQLINTEAFRRDANAHTFTITRNDNPEGLDRTLRRWERLRQKYLDWTLVNNFEGHWEKLAAEADAEFDELSAAFEMPPRRPAVVVTDGTFDALVLMSQGIPAVSFS